MTQQSIDFYRRNLPHVRLQGGTYFLTWRLHRSQADLRPTERDVIVDALRFFNGERYDLRAFVVMNDHVHVLMTPRPGVKPESIVQAWKSFTAHVMTRCHGRVAQVWQAETFDRVVRDDKELLQKLAYIQANPEKRWPGRGEYEWLWTG